MIKKKKKPKKKFKNIKFKLSSRQNIIIENYCKVHKTTSNKLIKSAIKDFISKYGSLPTEDNYVTENQLQLFNEASHSK